MPAKRAILADFTCQRGFTLIEAIVVLTLIGLVAGLLLPRLSKPPIATPPRIVGFLSQVQGDAVKQGSAVSVTFGDGRLHATNGKDFPLAEGERFAPRHAVPAGYRGGTHVVTFFPDGAMTEGEWILDGDRSANVIKFSTFTGKVGYAPYESG